MKKHYHCKDCGKEMTDNLEELCTGCRIKAITMPEFLKCPKCGSSRCELEYVPPAYEVKREEALDVVCARCRYKFRIPCGDYYDFYDDIPFIQRFIPKVKP